MTESDYIRALFAAEPDREYYRRRGSMGKAGARLPPIEIEREIYLKGDERIQEEGAYLHIVSEHGDVYLSRDMVERLAEKIRGGDSLFDY